MTAAPRSPWWRPDPALRLMPLWLLTGCALVAAVVYFSLNAGGTGLLNPPWDKFWHGLSYAVLMGWWLQLYPGRWRRVGLAVLFVGLGLAMEFAQSFHPLRYLDTGDMIANALGVLVGWSLALTPLAGGLAWIERLLIGRGR